MLEPHNGAGTAAATAPPPALFVPRLMENALASAEAALIAELALTFDLEALVAETCRDPFRC